MALRIDSCHIAGSKPAILRRRALCPAKEIFTTDPRSTGEQIAERDAIVRQFLAVGIDDFDVGAIDWTPLFQA
jgi:hypothetical protein